MEDFDRVCSEHQIWLIKYCSVNFGIPIYCIWFTDDDTDKLLLFKTGNILAIKSIHNIKELVYANADRINIFERLVRWLNSFEGIGPVENCTYNVDNFAGTIKSGTINLETIQCLVDFINLFGDFARQDENNHYLLTFADNKSIRQIWDYYYEFIFWPHFKNLEKAARWHIPTKEFDFDGLLNGIQQLVASFDAKIELIE